MTQDLRNISWQSREQRFRVSFRTQTFEFAQAFNTLEEAIVVRDRVRREQAETLYAAQTDYKNQRAKVAAEKAIQREHVRREFEAMKQESEKGQSKSVEVRKHRRALARVARVEAARARVESEIALNGLPPLSAGTRIELAAGSPCVAYRIAPAMNGREMQVRKIEYEIARKYVASGALKHVSGTAFSGVYVAP